MASVLDFKMAAANVILSFYIINYNLHIVIQDGRHKISGIISDGSYAKCVFVCYSGQVSCF